MSICIPVFLGWENTEDIQLQDDSAVPGTFANTDTSGVTAIDVVVNNIIYPYTTYSDHISWDTEGVVSIQFGMLPLPIGKFKGYLVLKDATAPIGVRWNPDFVLTVFQEAEEAT